VLPLRTDISSFRQQFLKLETRVEVADTLIFVPVGSDAIDEKALVQLQREVDHAANGLLAKGLRPSVRLIQAQVRGPRHRLIASLEDWAQRLGSSSEKSDSKSFTSPMDALVKMPRDRQVDVIAKAAAIAGHEAAKLKEHERRASDRQELQAEIERARISLTRLEERLAVGDAAPTLSRNVEKTRHRLAQMEAALGKSHLEPDP